MNPRTTSETIFENFLRDNNLAFERIEESDTPRPDYLVQAGKVRLMFEVKELIEDGDFAVIRDPSRPDIRMHTRTVGDHVRGKIGGARKQRKYAAQQGIPGVLLIYNNLDPMHLFGTEDSDFMTAMYGEYTVRLGLESGRVEGAFYGRNQSLRENHNMEFTAIARLAPCGGTMVVTLFENVFATVKIPYESLLPWFHVVRVELSSESPGLLTWSVGEDSWSRPMRNGTLTFTTTPMGATFNHQAKFEEPHSVIARNLQTNRPLTREHVENYFADFVSEISKS